MIQGFIGDVHGKFKRYKRLIAQHPNTIQVGDMGVGFRYTQGPKIGEVHNNPPHYAMLAGNHRFIRGNHDNPNACANHSQWIEDGTVENGIMFIGGATSIDREWRQEGFNWWANEQLSAESLVFMQTVYEYAKPKVMVTHECPEEVANALMSDVNFKKLRDPSRTREAFQKMFAMHHTKLWVFGHWHHSFDYSINGTRFVCLNELEYREFEI